MNFLENLGGEICKIIFPIKEEFLLGNSESPISICTLSSINLLKEIANSSLMKKIAVAGRLLSENKGIDSLVRNVLSKKNIKIILICGKDSNGHRPGHSLLQLYKNGMGVWGKIIDSESPNPFLTLETSEVKNFQKQVVLKNLMGEERISEIEKIIDNLNQF